MDATNPIGVTGVVLAGGLSRRMDRVDKGLALLDAKPMVGHVIERFAPQVGELIINANQHADAYGAYGYRVIADVIEGFAGPLAGLHAALSVAGFPLVATVPCDSPFLTDDLVARLSASLASHGADIAIARTFDQPHPVFALVQRATLPHLTAFLLGGGRKFDAWYATLAHIEVAFDDEADAFRNINTVDELQRAQQFSSTDGDPRDGL